jgi:hypothetical protein
VTSSPEPNPSVEVEPTCGSETPTPCGVDGNTCVAPDGNDAVDGSWEVFGKVAELEYRSELSLDKFRTACIVV